ncbi:disulfide bond formation protein DsbB [Marinospirillum celere]|uniref:Disulfide bond formation protein DsbB n=1 Tax=Marinospirillum celere TaxID=1122252 RepID=A0A1I1I2B4_9GAMM|nr:disulfide bond formation protein B [Marinospirillum celere]SFC30344.1 disulfide bond formation protein DsbB [Marinospirillum celere]
MTALSLRTLLVRHGLLLVCAGALTIVALAFLYEQLTGIQPCPLCWLQRWIFIGFAALSLLALVLGRLPGLRWLFIAAFALLTLTGIGIALRHLYIKLNPQSVSCGMDVETLLDFFPLREALTQMLAGSADCAQQADFLGLPLPSWSLSGYLLLGSLAILALWANKKR